MTLTPKKATTIKATKKVIFDPQRVFYMPAVRDTLARGQRAEIQALIKGAKAVKAEYGDIDGLIAALEKHAG